MGLIVRVRFSPESHGVLMKIVISFVECDGNTVALERLKVSVVGLNKWRPLMVNYIVIDNPAGLIKMGHTSRDTW